MKFAVRKNDFITNIIIAERSQKEELSSALEAELIDNSVYNLSIGDFWNGENWTRNVDGEQVVINTASEILGIIKSNKIKASKEALEAYLEENPLTWTDGNQYNVTEEKQSLLTSQLALYQTATAAGQPYTLKWNTTGGVCTEWAYEDLAALALAIGAYVQPLVSYQQTKEVDIMNCETAEAVEAVVIDYGTLA